MSKNQEIARIFFEIADILEMKNIAWKPRAYRQAARSVDSLEQDIGEIYKKGGQKLLEEIPGVGERIAKKIIGYLKTGKIKEYDKLKKTVPSHIVVLMEIPGMGPKKVKKLNQILKIKTIAQLEKAIRKNKIAKIPGFGEKSQQDILDGITIMKKSKGKIPLKQAQREADKLINQLKKLKEIKKVSVAGSLKRKKPLVRDIDILASSNKPEKIIQAFVKLKQVQRILAKGPTKATVILKSGIQSDLRVLPPESWGSGLLYFTGGKDYNIEMRKIAIKKGYKLNEYGLFDKQTGKMIAGSSEKGIYKKLSVKYIKPELREK